MDNTIDEELASLGGVAFAASSTAMILITQINPAVTGAEIAGTLGISVVFGVAYAKYIVEPLVVKSKPLPVRVTDRAINAVITD